MSPSHNRVYAADAARLMGAELDCVARALLPDGVGDVTPVQVAGVDYLGFETAAPLTGDRLRAVSVLSGIQALYQREGDLLRPVALERPDRFGSDLVTIPKYQGKTNEQFTRTLLTVTAMAGAWPERYLDGTMTVLDPMCGRGTTLSTALTLGLDATGIDLDGKDFEAYQAFLTTYLRRHRIKHRATTGAVRRQGKTLGRRYDVELAADKADYKAGRLQHLTYLNLDTTRLEGLLPAAQTNVIVADTPYGVQHGSHGDRLDRSPVDLLDRALPGWLRALRTGGTIGLAINRHVAPRDDVAELLTRHGLTVVESGGYGGLRHRVDASIDRDVVVARKG
ncbi:TRM11 family SAM-dependent methyltransferase [Arsenicicoccus sp. oral taxon 190]|uniref:TRM11 family SAM-dependent methyltransferase n=1 Tax=Arsenicicoccus sp. oral taxon 190 TaxID=1658671 RepID=UPI001C10CC49|nr:SAM-dependent methyltransferase [Arsenicicoccus sp. oral taxon 190]